jgi:hypothetical protein
VKGYVSCDGQPMVGAQITFVAQAKDGRDAHGYSGPDGVFQLSTFAPNDGALPGDYKVVVEYIPPAEAGPTTSSEQQAMEAIQKAAKSRQPKGLKYVIPAEYRDREKTPLRQKVPADGEVKLDVPGRKL